jgi:hypothetical protein
MASTVSSRRTSGAAAEPRTSGRQEMTNLTKREASGMTVNERLFVTGSLPAFDAAIAQKDRGTLREILRRHFLTEENIARIVDSVCPGEDGIHR